MTDSSIDAHDEQEHCAVCHAVIPARAPGGQCPICLLRLASGSIPGFGESDWDDQLLDSVQVRKFGDYDLRAEIARGGMGVVYRAWQRSAQREVALKMIVAGQLATPATVARFQNEAAAAARLAHPHIVPVYEFGEIETQHFFSMRYIAGGRNIATWARALPADERLPTIARTMSAVARAVAFAHERGVLHRDLKPSNVLIDEDDQPQITDFGLAKLLDDDDAVGLTLSSAILGSPSYMAPEQAEPRGHSITTATDVYGLGAILYELLSGRPPFQGATPLAVVRQVVESAPRPLLDVPTDLDTICRKCLAKEPGARYASATELADELERFARGEPIVAEPESTLALLVRWSRRHPVTAMLAAALLATLLAGFLGVSWQWRRAERARQAVASANSQLARTVAHLEWRTLDSLLERDYAGRALADLAARLRADPHNWQAASFALSLVEQRPFARPVGPAITVPSSGSPPLSRLAPDGLSVGFLETPRRLRVVASASSDDVFPPLATAVDFVDFAFSPDSTLLAAGTVDGTIHVWQLPSGKLLTRTATTAQPLRGVRFSEDGSHLVCHGGNLLAVVSTADLQQGHAEPRLIQADFPLAEVRCSVDGGRFVAWGGKEQPSVHFWGAPGSSEDFRLPIKGIRAPALDAAGRRVAVQTNTLEVQVWDLLERRQISTISAPTLRFNQVAISPDGERVIVGLHVGAARIFSATTALPTGARMPQLYQTSALVLDRSGTILAAGAMDYHARLWDANTGEPLGEPIPQTGPVRSLDLSADARRLLVCADAPGGNGHVLQLWHQNPPLGPAIYSHLGHHDFDSIRMSRDQRYLAASSELPKPVFSLFDVATHRVLLDRVPGPAQNYAVEFSPDGRSLYTITNRGLVRAWSVPDGRKLWPDLQLPAGNQPALLSPDGRWIVSGGTDGWLRFVDSNSGQIVRQFAHGALIKGIGFTEDCRRVVCGGAEGRATVWDTESGEKIADLKGHTNAIISTVFSPDGSRVLTASYDATARLWDVATGAPLGQPMPHSGELSHGAFSPDGRRVATAARDGTARLWDATTGVPLSEPMSSPATVVTVRFHPDGRRLLCQDLQGFRLWDVETGEPVTLHCPIATSGGIGFDSPSSRAQFSPDGRQLVLGYTQWEVTLWPLTSPPVPVPAWLPDFLDVLATGAAEPQQREDTQRSVRLLQFEKRARAMGDTDFYETWLRRYFGLVEK